MAYPLESEGFGETLRSWCREYDLLRRQTVEPRFGHIKHRLGVRRFLHRGLEAVRAEWSLVCAAVNVGILLRHGSAVSKMA